MEEVVLQVFNGTSRKPFQPQHTVRLDNTYACFATSWFDEIGIDTEHSELKQPARTAIAECDHIREL